MKTIARYPISPSTSGMVAEIPIGARVLGVSLSIHTYFLHVLADCGGGLVADRRIIAFKDDDTFKDIELGAYLGSCAQAGDVRRWHFFDQGTIGAEKPAPVVALTGYCSQGRDRCICDGPAADVRPLCGNWRKTGGAA